MNTIWKIQTDRKRERVCVCVRERERERERPLVCAWSSIDKGDSLACQITSPFNKKIGFLSNLLQFYFKNNPAFCYMGKLSGKPE